MRVFRVAPRERSSSPLDGEGSFRYGGRWSSPGTRIAYASTIPELARLEHSLHVPYSRIAVALLFVVAELPDNAVEELADAALPRDWDTVPAPRADAAIGDAWAASGRSLALTIPTALVPRALTRERNVLINPNHPLFKRASIRTIAFT
ncbi:MAG TPA: RES domain-containing protein [Candidatus Tyrphobacter sp.]